MPHHRLAVAIALGSNISDGNASKIFWLCKGLTYFQPLGLKLTKVSRGWISRSWPLGSGPDFVNAVVCAETTLLPHEVLDVLLYIEGQCGRVRGEINAPRTLDLDVIDYDSQCLSDERLVVPHPRMHTRQFVLGPLADVWPGWRHPVTGDDAASLLAGCDPAQQARPVYAAHELCAGVDQELS